MKIDHLLNEHKKGVKAIKYAKKPVPLVGPEAEKKKAKAKAQPPKSELEKHSKLKSKLESVTETAKLSTREKFKRSLKRAGYDPDAGAKRIEDLLAKQKKEREEREKQEKEQGVAESHRDLKQVKFQIQSDAHDMGDDFGDDKQTIITLAKVYKLKPSLVRDMLKSDQLEPLDENTMKQSEPPKPRNFVAKNAKTAGAGKHKDAKRAAKDVRGQKHKNKELAESEMGKIVDYKPGLTATLNTGPGMTTIVDLKKNPTSLTKDPATGKLKLVGPQAQGTPAQQSTQPSTIKAGDQVEIGKTTEDLLRLAGLK